jgi:GTPase KRas protein
MKRVTVGVVGSGGVGKTAISIQQVRGEFEEWYIPTVEDKFSTFVDVNGEDVRVDIIDTAGQDDFSGLKSQWYQSVDSFIIVYSVTDPDSVEIAEDIYKEACESCRLDSIPCVVAGNKADLSGPKTMASEERGKEFAKKIRCPHINTSAKTALNIEELFREAILVQWDRVRKSVERLEKNIHCCNVA